MAEDQVVVGSPERDIHVTALVQLEKVDISNQEENESELYKMRAKLFRFHTDDEDGAMWKERGIGDVKIMKHKTKGTYRLVMRQDKTLKLCANHALTKNMIIEPHSSNEKALIWTTPSDYSDGECKAETLCIRFGKVESTEAFTNDDDKKDTREKLVDDLASMKVKEEKDDNDNTTKDVESKNVDTNLKKETEKADEDKKE
ncbi:uncharacterized protein LOC130623284 [Hydractinia symbiolongicarpus]|uniref:uncharacterized protein LOC130623284 n=1 Tax=Hydractinia symbiolongicarpus TaxID=13093 RepID=UPI00255078FA|nr:uncharacterized protein LOC130623284 [Hydractinia symbiolongicarpus]